jgi:aminoglycoside phosphotransferase (APT) family kinase protein
VRLLSDETAVRAFLATSLGIESAGAEIEFLTGGVSSTVVRVVADGGCFVIKQALPRLRSQATWLSRPERSIIEARCAEVLSRLVPGSVLDVLAVDPDENLFTMQCAPEGSRTWKMDLMRGAVQPGIASAAGTLLGQIHTRTAASVELASAFADRSFFSELRLAPYLHEAASRHPDLAGELDWLVDRLREPGICLVHGDYSPKNLLVTPAGSLILLDHEVAHWGQPAFDVAFVLSHLCLKSVHFRGAGDHLRAATDLLAAYRQASAVADAATGVLGARLLAGLMLARVDGKSPVEYLTDTDGEIVRALARRVLRDRDADFEAVFDAVRRAIAGA